MGVRGLLNLLLAFLATGALYTPARGTDAPISLAQFGGMMKQLSSPEGYFDSDNFVSNEAAYLQIIPALRRFGVHGGAYIGVGPDQNYSYIAEIRPDLVFIIDIRRLNSLQHLYFKVLFQLSPSRVEYLERLFGRRLSRAGNPAMAGIDELLRRVDAAPVDAEFQSHLTGEALQAMQAWEIALTADDLKAVAYVARAFMSGGPDMKFTSYHRPPRPHHPSYRSLLTETDSSGAHTNYLAAEERFQVIRRLHRANRIIPLVGDLGLPGSVERPSEELHRRGLSLKCFYVSNVEFYLFSGPRWDAYVGNVRSLPWAVDACIIRSYANTWQPHPAQIPGYYMSTLLQPVQDFLANEAAGRNATYWDLVTRNYVAR